MKVPFEDVLIAVAAHVVVYIFGVITGTLPILLNRIKNWRLRIYQTKLLGKPKSEVDLVFGGTYAPSITVSSPTGPLPAEPPMNVEQIGVSEGLALGEASLFLSNIRRHQARLISHTLFDRGIPHPLLIVGGSSINKATQFFTHDHPIDRSLSIRYPEHVLIDQQTSTEYRATLKDGRLSRDYGVVVVGRNKFSGHPVGIAYGIWPQGTRAALRFLLNPGTSVRDALRLMRSDDGFVALIEVSVEENDVADPELILMRAISS